MAKYRNNLPHLGGGIFLAAGGLETTLIFAACFSILYARCVLCGHTLPAF